MKPFIGIKALWYTDVLTEALKDAKGVVALLNKATAINNSHEGTFSYTHDDPEITDYKNELSGNNYHRDKTSEGTKTITFSIGQYNFELKKELQGGSISTDNVVWGAGSNEALKYKCIIAQVKTGNFVIFTNASITAKVDTQEKGLMLGVTAVAMDNEAEGVSDEYWVDGDKIVKNASGQWIVQE